MNGIFAHTKAHTQLAGYLVTFAGIAMAVELSFRAGAIFKTIMATVLCMHARLV